MRNSQPADVLLMADHGCYLWTDAPEPLAARGHDAQVVLDDSQGRVLRGEAFRAALEEFCGDDEARLRLLASYGGRRLRRMLTGVYRTAGGSESAALRLASRAIGRRR